MNRRDVIALTGGAAALFAVPQWGRAQQSDTRVVGLLHSSAPNYFEPYTKAVHNGLQEAGFIEGQNLRFEYRYAGGDYQRLPELVADLLTLRIDVLLAAGGSDPAKAAMAATKTVPIVFVSAADPVRNGLVTVLNRPSGNVTGVSLLASALDGKLLDIVRQVVPHAARIAALINPNYPDAKAQADEFRAAAAQLGIEPVVLFAGTDTDIAAGFAGVADKHIGAIVLANDPYFGSRQDQLVALAARHAVPVMYWRREFAVAGGLISYGPVFADGYRQAGVYLGRILKGEKPGDLPVQQPVKFELVINLKTAKASGLDIPPTLLALADEVIE